MSSNSVRIYFQGERAGPLFQRGVERKGAEVRKRVDIAADDAAEQIEVRGKYDISIAGKFGERWTSGLHARVTRGGGNVRISVTHDVPYFSVFQTGKTIFGKPELAIPLDFAKDAQGVMARDFPGGLFRVDRDGKASLLLSFVDKQPKYFLKDQVYLPKKFHIVEIAREEARNLRTYYANAGR